MTRTRVRAMFASLAALALLAALNASVFAQDDEAAEPMPADGAEGITWQLAALAVEGEMVAVPEGIVVTLTLADGAASGNGGCNEYRGSYTLDGSELTLGDVASTKMLCEGSAGEVESAYFANLASVSSWSSNGGQLTLGDADGNAVLTFEPAAGAPAQPAAIEGPTWVLQEQAVDGALAALPEGVLVTLALQGDRAGGSGGCNSYFTTYELDGNSISFSEIGSTLMYCEGPGSDVETVYFTNLALVASWASDGATLTFSDASGNAILAYEAAPEAGVVGSWVAQGINNGSEAVVTSDITAEVTADFGADGSLTGWDGCNDYIATYQVDGDAIDVSDEIATTRMACASDELSEQSVQYVAALLAASTWSVDATGALELRDGSGALQVRYTPASS